MMRFYLKTSTHACACILILVLVLFYRSSLNWSFNDDSGSRTDRAASPESLESNTSESHTPSDALSVTTDLCSKIRNVKDVTIVIKTGATELWDKIPILLLSNLACANDVLIYSDLEDEVAGKPVFDALVDISEEAKATNHDFGIYRLLRQYRDDQAEVAELKKDHGKEAWDLDKYKFVHTVEGAFQQSPNSSWYFFIDADTYIVWSSLLPWLQRTDPSEKLYIGSAAYMGDIAFGHGGSGYVLSQAAMQHYIENTGKASTLFGTSSGECCGDVVIAKLLRKVDIKLTNVWPMFNGENVRTIPYGSNPYGYADHWCEPVITMHHVTPREINNFWKFEKLREPDAGPILFREVYQHAAAGHEVSNRTDWDNLSRDDPSEQDRDKANQSFEECGKVCAAEEGCYQYLYTGSKCKIRKGVVAGERPKSEDKTSYQSGWVLDKWEGFKRKTCEEPHWIMNRPG